MKNKLESQKSNMRERGIPSQDSPPASCSQQLSNKEKQESGLTTTEPLRPLCYNWLYTQCGLILVLPDIAYLPKKIVLEGAEILTLLVLPPLVLLIILIVQYFIKSIKHKQKIRHNVFKTEKNACFCFREPNNMKVEARKKGRTNSKNSSSSSFKQSKHNHLSSRIEILEKQFLLKFGDSSELEKILKKEKLTKEEVKYCREKLSILHQQKIQELRETKDYLEKSKIYSQISDLVALTSKENSFTKALGDERFMRFSENYSKYLANRSRYYKGIHLLSSSEELFNEISSIYDYQKMVLATEEVISKVDEAVKKVKITPTFAKLHDSIKEFVTDIIEGINLEFDNWEPESESDAEILAQDKDKLLGKAGILFWNLQQLDEDVKNQIDEEKRLSLYPDKETCEYMEQQEKLFREELPNLIRNYSNIYIHFEDGKVLDHDKERDRLVKRVLKEDDSRQIFIKKVPSHSLP